jgi:hypothetical protein
MVLAARTGQCLPAGVNLTVASEQWLRSVLVRTDKGTKLARRHFEVCVFAALGAALKAGDVAVEGSDAYADYREQLLPWSECEAQVAEYCQVVELPATAAGFVKYLQDVLSTTAKRVDAALPSSGHVVINDKGEPVIKRGLRRQPSASAGGEAALLEPPGAAPRPYAGQRQLWTGFRHGSFPAQSRSWPIGARYILTVFAYGCNLGPRRLPAMGVWPAPGDGPTAATSASLTRAAIRTWSAYRVRSTEVWGTAAQLRRMG